MEGKYAGEALNEKGKERNATRKDSPGFRSQTSCSFHVMAEPGPADTTELPVCVHAAHGSSRKGYQFFSRGQYWTNWTI